MADAQLDHDQAAIAYVNQMFDLGFFDKEFTFWGCVYKENGERKYYITANADKAYEKVKECLEKDFAVTPVEKYLKWQKVPTGQETRLRQQAKREFALRLQQQYSLSFLDLLETTAKKISSNIAQPYLMTLKKHYQGTFDLDGLYIFKSILEKVFEARQLTVIDYLYFKTWVEKEIANCPALMPYGHVKERIFSGFLYEKSPGKYEYIYNATPFLILERKTELTHRGFNIFPIFRKSYLCATTDVFYTAQKEFATHLKQLWNETYIAFMESIWSAAQHENKSFSLQQVIADYNLNTHEAKVLRYYFTLWNIPT